MTTTPGGRPAGPARPATTRLLLGVAIALIVLLTAVAVHQVRQSSSERAVAWFAPYVDTTLTPLLAFEDPEVTPVDTVVLGFVVAKNGSDAACTPSWGGAYGLDEAATAIDLDRRIARYRDRGGRVVVSFGGAANRELALACTDQDALVHAYEQVMDRYDSRTIDLDIEGGALADTASVRRRARAIAEVQRRAVHDGHRMSLWLTLPVAPEGMLADAVSAVDAMLEAGASVTGVNLMTMDFGGARPQSVTMSQAVEHALEGAHGQLQAAYRRAGRPLDSTQAWGKLGATPMIGVNDTLTDRFSRADAQRLVRFSRDKGLGRLSMWSANRDAPCPQGPALDAVSNTCSGFAQSPLDYSRILDRVSGRLLELADDEADPADEVVDDPAKSPYPVWDAHAVYEQGQRVVRHHRVYVAKWWTQGDDPVLPVANVHDSPWRLVGPVLASDRPPSTTTLPAGTYPEWNRAAVYRQGDRVLRKGVAYVADWYAQGIDPAAPPTGDGPSPWRSLATS